MPVSTKLTATSGSPIRNNPSHSSPNFKFPISLNDGLVIEAVYYGSGTLCISSQAGCALSCPFCASGSQGLKRQLTAAELHLQLQRLRQNGFEPQRLTISGIGEPLHNWENVRSYMIACQKNGLGVSVTTTGVGLKHLEELVELAENGVMISLHAVDTEIHQQLIPKGPDFQLLCTEIDRIYHLISRRKRRKIGINYLLISCVNDNEADLLALQRLMQRWPDFTLHLLCYNPVTGMDFHSDPDKMDDWHDYLQKKGISVRRPNRWRNSAEGGCGTLYLRGVDDQENRSSL
jgi:23S rRNA (adenine2503-C2)-methyltransferase